MIKEDEPIRLIYTRRQKNLKIYKGEKLLQDGPSVEVDTLIRQLGFTDVQVTYNDEPVKVEKI